MLEQQGLLLRPWQAAAEPQGQPQAPGGRRRDVLDLATGQPLGFVRGPASKGCFLVRWLTRRVLEVYEMEDASLLCTVSRPWGLAWGWEVLDADDRRVAVVYRHLILHASGRVLAVTDWFERSSAGHFLGPSGTELATFQPGPEGMTLNFGPALARDPFARMALLGAVLVLDEP
jgi:hypothetical protein